MKNPYKSYENMKKRYSDFQGAHPHGEAPDPAAGGRHEPEQRFPGEELQEDGRPELPVDDISAEQHAEPAPTACPERNELEEERLRMLADLDNARKRLNREKEEAVKFAAEKVLSDLLPTLDNLDLALSHGQNNPACKDLLLGVEMTKKLLLDTVAKHGLVPVGQEGEPFNPEYHEAMSQEEREDMEPNHIAQLFQKGYVLKDRLLRPAKVVVSKAAPGNGR